MFDHDTTGRKLPAPALDRYDDAAEPEEIRIAGPFETRTRGGFRKTHSVLCGDSRADQFNRKMRDGWRMMTGEAICE